MDNARIIEAAYLSGFEPSEGVTGDALLTEAQEFLFSLLTI